MIFSTFFILCFISLISLNTVSGLTPRFIDISLIVSPIILSSSNSFCKGLSIASSQMCIYSVLVKSKLTLSISSLLPVSATRWAVFYFWFSIFSSLLYGLFYSSHVPPFLIIEFSIVSTSVISCIISSVSVDISLCNHIV